MSEIAHRDTEDRCMGIGVSTPEAPLTLGSILSGALGTCRSSGATRLPVQVISQFGVPRWVLPEDTRRAIPVLQSWRPYSAKSRLMWAAVVNACRMGALHKLPGVVCDTLMCDLSYWRQHLPEYSDSWAIIAYLGNPSPTRKALLFFIDRNARIRAVAKVPICSASKTAIINEADILEKIRPRLFVPKVLFADNLSGIAAQSWVQGRHVSRSFGREHLEFLLRLPSERKCARLIESRGQLEMRIAAHSPLADTTLLRRALMLLENEEEMRECVEHGDFTPWNLRRLHGGQLTAIDWEWSIEAGYPWQDVCRYFYLQAFLFRKAGNVWDRLKANPLLAEYQRRLDLSPKAVRGLTMRFLLQFLCDEHEAGDQKKVDFAVQKIHEVLNQ